MSSPDDENSRLTTRRRLFVALDLPDEVRAALPAFGPREKLHLTLVFLGERDAAPALDLRPPCAPIEITGAIRLSRVVAAGARDPSGAWTAYQATLADALGVAERRRWRPHITLTRRRLETLPEVTPVSFVPTGVTLYASRPGRGGSRYEALARIPLPS